MEIHAHTHSPRKKWTHYFWEFFMLFLAITAGFFVENLREQKVERHREKQFIHSIIQDLSQDIINLDSLIDTRHKRMVMIDSLALLLRKSNPDEYGNKVYFYARWLTYTFMFVSNDRTIQQLKNGGNLRLIRNQEVSNRIMDYDQQLRFVVTVNERENSIILDYIKSLEELFDSEEFDRMLDKKYGFLMPNDNPRLISKERDKLQKILGTIHFLKAANSYLLNWTINQVKQARSTLSFIEQEYHLK